MLRLLMWINQWACNWLDMLCGLVGVITFTLYRPWWDMRYRCWSSKYFLVKRKAVLRQTLSQLNEGSNDQML